MRPPPSASARSRTVAPSTRRCRALRFLGEEVLEDAAVDLVARHGEIAARADLGDASMSRRPSDEKKRKPNFSSCARLQVLLQAEHLARSSGRRSRPSTRRPCARLRHRMRAPLEHQDVEVGERCLQLQRQRQAGEAAAGDDDVVRVALSCRSAASAQRAARATQRQARARSAPGRSPSASKAARHRPCALPAEGSRRRRAHRHASARRRPRAAVERRHASARSRCRREDQRARRAGRRFASPTPARRVAATSKATSSTGARVGRALARRFEQAGAEAARRTP